jgi:hypothetical protein
MSESHQEATVNALQNILAYPHCRQRDTSCRFSALTMKKMIAIIVVNYRPRPPKSMLTVSTEHVEETRGVELLKFPRVCPETSHRQAEEYSIENKAWLTIFSKRKPTEQNILTFQNKSTTNITISVMLMRRPIPNTMQLTT